jgi:hypothetical protein
MEIDYQRWYPAVEIRLSRRQYDPLRPLSAENLSTLKKLCLEFRPFPEARVELITDSPDRIFDFILGSYGVIRNPTAALAFIGDMRQPHVQETVGYTGEAVVLEATALGLGTCWVAGFFSPAAVTHRVKLAPYERVLAVSPLGYPLAEKTLAEKALMGFAHSRKRKPINELISGLSEEHWPIWLKSALEAARIAPSATNRQPWRFYIEKKSVTISIDLGKLDFKVSKRLDCGIAMLHLEVAALNSGIHGHWELQDTPHVARFSYEYQDSPT